MELGTVGVEVIKKASIEIKKAEEVRKKIDTVIKSVETVKKVTAEKNSDYVGNALIGKVNNEVKASLMESLNKYFDGKALSYNVEEEDSRNKALDNNYSDIGLNKENQILGGSESSGKLSLQYGLTEYLDSKNVDEKVVRNCLDTQPDDNNSKNEISETKKIPTRNQDLEGKEHPETGVPFVIKQVENSEGDIVEVVVPEFDSEFDVQLPDELCGANDNNQFNECNRQLKEAIETDEELQEKFADEQIEQIMDGETPDGYTWHHDAEKGKIQLVDSEIHAKTGHTGGKSIWGGGSENR